MRILRGPSLCVFLLIAQVLTAFASLPHASRVFTYTTCTNGLLAGVTVTNHFHPAYGRDRLQVTGLVTTLTHEFGYDGYGRLSTVANPQNHVVEFRYNGANQITNLMTWVEGQQREKHFAYTSTNAFSRLTRVTTPMGKLIRYDYTFRSGPASALLQGTLATWGVFAASVSGG